MSASGPRLTRPCGSVFSVTVHRLLEVAVLEREVHRPVRLRLAGAAEQFDHVVVAELGEVQVLDLVRPVDPVQRERLRRATGRPSCRCSGS